jgi:predicted O-methyltransferase YrrM
MTAAAVPLAGTAEKVDKYIESTYVASDDALIAALAASDAAGLPPIAVSPPQGQLLQILARSIGARRILEIGTLGGYSSIWLARALPAADGDARLVTLELEATHAAVARSNLARAGLERCTEVRVGAALDSLAALVREGGAPFDFCFIDADKQLMAEYFEFALQLTRKGALIVCDNVVRQGAVADADATDERVRGVRRLNERFGADPRATTTQIQTVGSKGYDGFGISIRN